MSLNFAPYSSPPSSPRNTISRLPTSSSSTSAGGSQAKRPKSPWFGVGSYQNGGKPSDLNSANAISSSSYSSSAAQSHNYPSGDVLWDAESGNAGPSSLSSGGGAGGYAGSGAGSADAYETAFGWRVDLEGAAAYILGPLLAIVLLILETKNDYVRFHAWQSLLLGCGLAILHLLFLWSRFFSWIIFLADLAIYGQLAWRALKDADTLERYFLPRIGEMASQWVDEE